MSAYIKSLCRKANQASREMAIVDSKAKERALKDMAKALMANSTHLIEENKKDIEYGRRDKLSAALIDRLLLNRKRIKGMADSILEISKLKDPVGEILETRVRPNGLVIKKVRVPIGVILIIYESRPNVTSDCIALCLKAGNCVILRGGSEAIHSNIAIFETLEREVLKHKLPNGVITIIKGTDRNVVSELLMQEGLIDLVMPRGGESLIREVSKNSRIPVIKHYKGVCHTYVDESADLKIAQDICFNAKVQRPGVCNAMETMLVNRMIAKKFLVPMIQRFKAAGVEIRGCGETMKIITDIKRACEDDWYKEYLDLILSVKIVNNIDEAIGHIMKYGSRHSDAIVTRNKKMAEKFLNEVDSACVYVNASTRFTDGGEFGKGAEIGISTDKIHARGPMGVEELTSYKYVIYGKGQIRK
ncbi:MAG: glutamate-5-semialdehyde dehydrogenase [Omnitrophica bacterium RIFCSPLOWO2_02_FULL_45_16]|nr:MAG: glutamate-5-semialdehyde dehydrogenase [Omnitrophica bacterium RIFCSPHIGHO2_02_FULL_46_20]OGW95072.1 MAG: glutamate-5-semialdehyde dehydrogenase [Omnitrophica bacterium RIFCSPLOWO2_01_FULL_45_24]OGW99820.1 MAG: glutamate-5-semialdehyde dehydrogenase [Omnitrophica bacterium RIFCSPLOWO2_02_FULL_45_16]